jgi:hypothetical protein
VSVERVVVVVDVDVDVAKTVESKNNFPFLKKLIT